MTTNEIPSRADTLALMHEYTASESLRKHMLAVEGAMRAYAQKFDEDEERWGITGLIHDFDYERFPNNAHSPTEEHPSEGVRLLRSKGYPEEILQAILGHAQYTNTPRESKMAKTLFAVDELTVADERKPDRLFHAIVLCARFKFDPSRALRENSRTG